MTRVLIDPNVRVRGQCTFAGIEDADGPLQLDQTVEVYEPESGMVGVGEVAEIDAQVALVYLRVDWGSMRIATLNDERSRMASPPLAGLTQGVVAIQRWFGSPPPSHIAFGSYDRVTARSFTLGSSSTSSHLNAGLK